MKKNLIGAIVAGLILFVWQTLSWPILNLHGKTLQYTPKQDTVMAHLNEWFSEEGGYIIPSVAPGSSMEDMEKVTQQSIGKPWAQILYHKSFEYNMAGSMIRGLLTNIVLMLLFCWILSKFGTNSFTTTLTASVFTGLIAFTNIVYTQHIWYQSLDLYAHLTDAIVGWGAAGLWLGWWMNRKNK